jgi:1-acyl-sn-glycerol-3-phosphate acyltransferase
MQKPLSRDFRPEITSLPRLTAARRALRTLYRWLSKIVIALCTRYQVHGLENFPSQGPALVVVNHLGDADIILGLAFFPAPVDALAKMEMYDFPVVGKLMDSYGVVWVHRGQPDRRALRAALQGFRDGRLIGVAPEGRESLTGSLEEGTGGAAYLALKGNVPIVPVTFTGTENARIYGNLKRMRRTAVSLTVGLPFRLEVGADSRQAVQKGTDLIMHRLAEQLPAQYRGVYQKGGTEDDGE